MDSEQVTETSVGWSRRVRGEPSDNFNPDIELEPNEQSMRLVVVNEYMNINAASLALAKLQAHGVDGFLRNDCVAAANPAFGIAVGIELLVPADQLEDAQELLALGRCPKCGSKKIRTSLPKKKFWAWLMILLSLGLMLMYTTDIMHCDDCGFEWK